MSKNENNDMVYNLSILFGTGLGLAFRAFFSLMFAGIITASQQNVVYFTSYGILFFLLIIPSCRQISITMIVIIALYAGIKVKWKEFPYKKRIKAFNSIFSIIGLQTSDNCLPTFLYEEELSEYCLVLAFQSLIPLSVWKAKQEQLEVYLNQKIVDIKQDPENNRNVFIMLQSQQLPEYMEWDDSFNNINDDTLLLGIGNYGKVGLNLTKYAHAFIAGETGSGKSNLMKCLIEQSLKKDYDVELIDFKRGVSFMNFSDMVTIHYEYSTAQVLLERMVRETERRLDLFRKAKVDNIREYNNVCSRPLARKVIFIDELAELLKVRDRDISHSLYDSLETLTRLSRAVGIHLIMGIQRPDSTVVNGQIKSNVAFRICGRFVDKEPSRIMLGTDVASSLDDVKGRFIVKASTMQEIQSFYYADNHTYARVHETQQVEVIEENIKNDMLERELKEPHNRKITFDFNDI
ncbi:FtsK/SpoIIIE domain-containing protein [[Clostridium] symbiosum]|uniref:FtsK/SpoIIIE domain-containing protein n=1 Tax=Clostridium symbiosum TaxID=1512 RepID=UPI001D06F333|nr:FtsK/SpoIIIE domain-containing protein [[Clostridium] symbiosum]MCB6608449.1 DUF87 domain-containing protein [[Clostridium] symbiosum]MCB6930663.1 DUF87 domain-containing protein [[Clostridium] symbiosum]